jgi:hypothetical protein
VFKGANNLMFHYATYNTCVAGAVSQGYRKEILCRVYIGQTRGLQLEIQGVH